MAKEVKVSIIVDDNGTMRLTEKSAKKMGMGLDKAGKSASTADRALKGAAQASSNTTKNFSKMSQGITGGLVPAYATLAANIFAISALFQFFSTAADTSNLISGQEALAASTGIAYGSITASLKDATNGMLSFKEAASATAIGLAAGVSADQLERLARVATNASAVLGRDLTDSFNRLIRGATKAEPELLDELGIILRLEDAAKRYKDSLNITGRQLTQFEKQQAVTNEILRQGEEKYAKISEFLNPSAQAVNRLKSSFDNLVASVQKLTIDTLAPVFDFLSKNTTSLVAALGVLGLGIVSAFTPALPTFADIGTAAKGAATSIKGIALEGSAAGKEIIKTGEISKKNLKILEKAAKSKTSTVLNLEKMTKVEIQRNLATIRAGHALTDAQNTVGFARYKLQVIAGYNLMTAAHGRFMGTVLFGLRGLSLALRALPFIGIGVMLIQLAAQFRESFFPLSENVKEANDKLDGLIERTQRLNKELKSTVDLRKVVNTGVEEYAVQLGQALQSASLLSKIGLYNTTKEGDPEKRKKALEDINNTLENLISLDSRFEKFRGNIEELGRTGAISETFTKDFQDLSEEIIKGSTAINGWQQQLTLVRDTLNSTLDIKETNPFKKLTDVMQGAEESAKAAKLALNAAFEQSKRDIAEKSKLEDDALNERIKKAEAAAEKAENRYNNKMRPGYNRLGKAMHSLFGTESYQTIAAEGEMNRTKKALQDLLDEQAEEIELSERQNTLLEQRQEEYNRLVASYEYQMQLAQRFNSIDEEVQRRLKSKADLEGRIFNLKTAGITIEDKISNLESKKLADTLDLVDARDRLFYAENVLAAAKSKNSSANEKEVADAQTAVDLAKQSVEEQERLLEIKTLLNIRTQFEIQKQKIVLEGQKKSLGVLTRGKQLAIDIANERRKANPIDRANGLYRLELKALRNKRDTLMVEQNTAQELWLQAYFANLKGARNDIELQNALKRYRLAQLSVAAAQDELDARKNIASFAVEDAKADVENARFRQSLLGLSDRELFIAKKIREKRKEEGDGAITEAYKAQLNILYEIELATKNIGLLQDSFKDSLTSSIDGLIQGTMTLKDAFKNVALSVLKQLSQMIAQALTFRLLMGTSFGSSIMGGLGSLGSSISVGIGRNGGVFSAGKKMGGYADGGIAKGSTSGYPAILHGTEAVVPLPDGKSIPVSMPEGGMSTNNVTVNVNMENGQTDSQSDGQQGANLGKLLAGAVKEELQRQKRPGGILSPYGAA